MDGYNATIYGAQLVKSPTNENNYRYGIIGADSEVFTEMDLVTVVPGTGLEVAAASTAIIGVVAASNTMASDNTTNAQYEPAFTPIDQQYEWLMGTNADLDPLNVGTLYNITGTTGLIQVDVAGGATTGTSAIVELTKVDPNQLGGTGVGSGLRQGYFKIVRTQ